MDNKELPQEVRNKAHQATVKDIGGHYQGGVKGIAFDRGLALRIEGAIIASDYYEPQLQAKDTTIKEQAEKIEKLTGLLRNEMHTKAYQAHYDAYKIEEGANEWADMALEYFCKQHGI